MGENTPTHNHIENIRHDCDHAVTYEVIGPQVKFMGYGDLHSSRFDSTSFLGMLDVVDDVPTGACEFFLHIYPSQEFYEATQTQRPLYYTLAIVGVFVMTALVFLMYDWLVARRQRKLLTTATQSNAILSSLFPEKVRQRLMKEQQEKEEAMNNANADKKLGAVQPLKDGKDPKMTLSGGDAATSLDIFGSKPIADLFPSATV
jgi:hypothetical protein